MKIDRGTSIPCINLLLLTILNNYNYDFERLYNKALILKGVKVFNLIGKKSIVFIGDESISQINIE